MFLYSLKRWNITVQTWKPKSFVQFEFFINALVNSFWFIWIPMLSVYVHYKYFCSAESDVYKRQIPSTKINPRAVMFKSIDSVYH